jgi:hypothetical protein
MQIVNKLRDFKRHILSLTEVVLVISYITTVKVYVKLESRQVGTQNSSGGRGRREAVPEAMFNLCLIFLKLLYKLMS